MNQYDSERLPGTSSRSLVIIPGEGSRDEAETNRLSQAQERMWFQMSTAPGDPSFNMVDSWRIRGPLDIDALRFAVAAIANRHDVLRTRFSEVSGIPTRIIVENSATLDVIPLNSNEDEINSFIEAEISRPFHLAQEPPLRCRLLAISPRDHVLIITIHHIACDGKSLSILYRELRDFYLSRGTGLPTLTNRYTDYIAREQGAITRKRFEKELDYWRDALAASATLVDLPFDRPHRGAPSFKTTLVSRIVPAPTCEKITLLAREERVPRFIVYLAAYAIMLRQCSGQDDFIIGILISGRSITERNIIGLYTNTLPLRIDLTGNPGFREVVHRLRTTLSKAYTHAKVPINLIIDAIKPVRSPNRNPLFQLIFSHENPDEADCVLDGASVTRIPLDHHSMPAAFDLGMFIQFTGNVAEATVRLYYSPEVFNESTIDQMVRSYLSCLTSGITNALAPISVSSVSNLAMPGSLNRSLDSGSGPMPPRPYQLSSAVRGAPTTHTEKAIAAIWQTVLGCELLDPDDDFFDAGGNSLLALQVVNRIEESLNIRLNVSTLFSARSIQALAEVVDAELWRRGSGTSSQGEDLSDAPSHGRDLEVGTL